MVFSVDLELCQYAAYHNFPIYPFLFNQGISRNISVIFPTNLRSISRRISTSYNHGMILLLPAQMKNNIAQRYLLTMVSRHVKYLSRDLFCDCFRLAEILTFVLGVFILPTLYKYIDLELWQQSMFDMVDRYFIGTCRFPNKHYQQKYKIIFFHKYWVPKLGSTATQYHFSTEPQYQIKCKTF